MLTSQILSLISSVCGVIMYLVLAITLLRAGKALGEDERKKNLGGTCKILGYLGILFAIARASQLLVLIWEIIS